MCMYRNVCIYKFMYIYICIYLWSLISPFLARQAAAQLREEMGVIRDEQVQPRMSTYTEHFNLHSACQPSHYMSTYTPCLSTYTLHVNFYPACQLKQITQNWASKACLSIREKALVGLQRPRFPQLWMNSLVGGSPLPLLSSFLSSSLALSDINVYEPQMRAHLGTAAHFCKEFVRKLTFTLHPTTFRHPWRSGRIWV